MPTQTFTPPRNPQLGTGEQVEFRVLRAQFGDGYEQVAGDGLNTKKSTVTLLWHALPVSESQSIRDFMIARSGHEYFLYTLPGETTARKWRCGGFSVSDAAGGLESLTVTLREVYDL